MNRLCSNRLFRLSWAGVLLAASACTQSDVVMVDANLVEVSPSEASVIVGQQTQLTATVLASGGEPLSGRTITWVSDDPAVATADASGRVSGVAVGTATIRAISEGATGTARVMVTAGPVPVLSVNPVTVAFAAVQNGATPGERTVSVTNSGTGQLGALAVAVRYPDGAAGGWLDAVLGGTSAPATITLSANQAGLGPGTYTGFVDVSAAGAQNSPVAIRVELSVGGPQPAIGLGATSVTFAAPAGGANPAKQSVAVTNAGGGTLSGLAAEVTYTAGQPSGWLTAALGSTTAPTPLELTAVTGALPVGVYTATVRVSSGAAQNSPQDVQVTFTVGSPPPAIGVNPASLAFTAVTGTAAPTRQVAITNPGSGALTGLGIAVTYPGGQPSGWVTTSLAGTTAPTTLTVGANAAGLAAGSYSASISITSPVASNSPTTVSVTFQVSALPNTPSGLSATAVAATRVDLAWTDNSTDETGFQVERSVSGGAWTPLASLAANATRFTDATALPATTHSYRVRACSGSACSPFTAAASATTPELVPGIPSNLVAATVSPTRIGVTWEAPPNGGPVAGYRIERRIGTGGFTLLDSVGSGTRSLQDTGLTPGTTYGYRVQACNATGCSAYSAIATATTGALSPVADAGGPYSGVVGSTVTLDGSASNDPDGTIASYRWEIADGGDATILTGVRPTYACTTAGTFAVTLTVTDNSGATANDGTTVECTPPSTSPPGVPTGITFTDVAARSLTVNWSAPTTGGVPTHYVLERQGPTGPPATIAENLAVRSFADSGLSPGTQYRYRVSACNAAGCSSTTEWVYVTTLSGG